MARRFIPALPKSAWSVVAVVALSSLGTGMTLPFEMIYLHDVRGLSLTQASLAMAVSTGGAFCGNPLGGYLCDRLGSRITMTLGLLVEGCGVLALANASTFGYAMAAVGIAGVGGGASWPAQDAMIATVVPEGKRPSAFSMRHAALNAGFAVGGIMAAMIARSGTDAIIMLFIIDAATFFLAATVIVFIDLPGLTTGQSAANDVKLVVTRPRYRTVLRDGTFLRLSLINFLLVAAGYAQLYSAVPVFLLDHGFDPAVMGAFSAFNAVTVVAGQIIVLRYLKGVRRTSLIAILSTLWSVSWLLLITVVNLSDLAALITVVVVAVVFAIGETLLPPSVPVLVNAIAPDDLRGRYNGLAASAFSLAAIIGTAIAGWVLDHGYGRAHFAACIGVFICAALLALRTSSRLPTAVNRGEAAMSPETKSVNI